MLELFVGENDFFLEILDQKGTLDQCSKLLGASTWYLISFKWIFHKCYTVKGGISTKFVIKKNCVRPRKGRGDLSSYFHLSL